MSEGCHSPVNIPWRVTARGIKVSSCRRFQASAENPIHDLPVLCQPISSEMFILLCKQQSFVDVDILKMKSLLSDPSPSFSAFLPLFLTCTFTLHKQKTAPVYPSGLEKGHRGHISLARLLPDTTVELSVTLPHIVSAWSDKKTRHCTPPPPPATCSRSRSYSYSQLVQQAWDAEYELGRKGEQGSAGWQWKGAEGQGNREMHSLARVPVASDQRHFRSVPTACHRPTLVKVTVKGHSLCMPILTDIHIWI